MPFMPRDLSLPAAGATALGILGIAVASDVLLRWPQPRSVRLGRGSSPLVSRVDQTLDRATVTAAHRLNRAAGTLAASVLADSAIEHYRGSFENKAMFTPLVVSALTLATSVHGTSDSRPIAHSVRDGTYLLAAITGLIGTGFHIYNVGKKTGGFSWQNVFYGAPLGAPFAILLSGLLGFARNVSVTRHAGGPPGYSICRPGARWRR